MRDEMQPLHSIQAGLEELSAAERAGVFAPTRVDTRAMMAAPSWSLRSVYRWASAAAVVALATGLWAWRVSNDQPNGPGSGPLLAHATNPCDGSLSNCMTGPRHVLGTKCDIFDYDEDGDIDMLDVRTHQLKCQGATG